MKTLIFIGIFILSVPAVSAQVGPYIMLASCTSPEGSTLEVYSTTGTDGLVVLGFGGAKIGSGATVNVSQDANIIRGAFELGRLVINYNVTLDAAGKGSATATAGSSKSPQYTCVKGEVPSL